MSNLPALHRIFGLFYIVTCFCSVLYGFSCLQAWWYFRSYASRDCWIVKSMVSAVMVCETIQMTLMSASMYQYCISGVFEDGLRTEGHKSIDIPIQQTFIVQFLFSPGIAIIVQMFYCFRIYKISMSKIVPTLLAAAGWTSCVIMYVLTGITLWKGQSFRDFLEPKMVILSTVMNASAAFCDIAISGVMVFYLHRRKSGIRSSTSMINRMILFSASTGMLTSLFALISLICEFTLPFTFTSILFYLLCGRLYTNSLLITLNGRLYIIEGSTTPQIGFRIPRIRKTRKRGGNQRKVLSTPMVTMIIEESVVTEKPEKVDEEENLTVRQHETPVDIETPRH
ncbi:hypothetical protein E1B28_004846 [Marasmius oreades]|uniref:DUF6534 domain-containing protein n=1 Tax=Marasmius oreades TaxID=181124 RepID=A0A9P7UZI5_9AGAR|nr:uncharacterized protein E1B28_004846 [Marasmius oreades]KAG7097504.1 hypothetical protein E1B28_004846 [Marasmius oreades]